MKLDIQTLEDESKGEAGEPFTFTMKDGTEVELVHPEDVDLNLILGFDMEKPLTVLPLLIGEERFKALLDQGLSLRTLKTLLTSYAAHFGIPMPGESNASPRTSNGTARQSRPTSARRKTAAAS